LQFEAVRGWGHLPLKKHSIATMIFSGGQNLHFAVSAHEIAKVLKSQKAIKRN